MRPRSFLANLIVAILVGCATPFPNLKIRTSTPIPTRVPTQTPNSTVTFSLDPATIIDPIAPNTVNASLLKVKVKLDGASYVPIYGLDYLIALTEGVTIINFKLQNATTGTQIGNTLPVLARDGDEQLHAKFGYGSDYLLTVAGSTPATLDLRADIAPLSNGATTGALTASLAAVAGNGVALATGSSIVVGPTRQITNE